MEERLARAMAGIATRFHGTLLSLQPFKEIVKCRR
jgi:hypothetical protein